MVLQAQLAYSESVLIVIVKVTLIVLLANSPFIFVRLVAIVLVVVKIYAVFIERSFG